MVKGQHFSLFWGQLPVWERKQKDPWQEMALFPQRVLSHTPPPQGPGLWGKTPGGSLPWLGLARSFLSPQSPGGNPQPLCHESKPHLSFIPNLGNSSTVQGPDVAPVGLWHCLRPSTVSSGAPQTPQERKPLSELPRTGTDPSCPSHASPAGYSLSLQKAGPLPRIHLGRLPKGRRLNATSTCRCENICSCALNNSLHQISHKSAGYRGFRN